MFRLSIGTIALFVVAALIYFGFAHRVLDRMRLTDRAALAIIAAMIVGSFINIPITLGLVDTTINVGGALIPIALAIYVLSRAGTSKEWIRAIVAIIATTAAVHYAGMYSDADPGAGKGWLIDPIFVLPLIAGTVAYLFGRSRRSAFIAATIGVLGLDVINFIYLTTNNIEGLVQIGGAGIFDSIVLSGIIAVLLAEVVGETRERLQGGPATTGRPKELLEALRSIPSVQQKPNITEEHTDAIHGEDGEARKAPTMEERLQETDFDIEQARLYHQDDHDHEKKEEPEEPEEINQNKEQIIEGRDSREK